MHHMSIDALFQPLIGKQTKETQEEWQEQIDCFGRVTVQCSSGTDHVPRDSTPE